MLENNNLYKATLRDMLLLEVPQYVRISPDASKVAFTVRSTNWKDNRHEYYCQVYDEKTGATRRLTRSGIVRQIEWIDDETLAVLKPNGEKAQIWLFEGGVGEGWQLTDHKTGVDWFYPFAGGIVFLARQPEKDEKKSRLDQYGKYTHFEQEESASALYFVGFPEYRDYQKKLRASTEDEGKKLVVPVVEISKLFQESIAIKEVVVSRIGNALYLNCWKRDEMVYLRETRVFQIQLDTASALAKYLEREQAKKVEKKDESSASDEKDKKEDVSYLGELNELHLPKGARVMAVSPDGSQLLIGYKGRDQMLYTREDLWLAAVKAIEHAPDSATALAAMTNLTADFDREMMSAYWTRAGIFGDYVDGTHVSIARLHPDKPTPLDLDAFEYLGFHVSDDGHVAFSGATATSFTEIYFAEPAKKSTTWRVKKLTDYGQQILGWDLGTVETIRWKSKDGTEIEGVLRKPSDFDPGKRYPLALVVHGGPTWFSSEYLLSGEDMFYYPALQFNYEGMLVLKPNYRGSVGRGQAFEELNVNNLGVGDLWDLESAVDHLAELGWVDPEKVGCMGWSQGGYISAFAGLHSDKFRAVSVGAGISDWYTYHISNDIPDFTRDYLSGSPFRDRGLYQKTAPISNISNAKTPMLIQHGSEDQRVPLSNATELYRGLKEMGVHVELFIYPGMAHPISKPRENHAVMYQNLNWFRHYLLGEKLKLE